MPRQTDDLEARLGGSLAETARLNDPGRDAARIVGEARGQAQAARNRRRFRLALALAALVLLGVVLLALRYAPG